MVLFYFVFPVQDETKVNNEMLGLSNSLASSILNPLAQDLQDKSSDLRTKRIRYCNDHFLSHSFIISVL